MDGDAAGTARVALEGQLRYPDSGSAAAAYAAMMDGRAGVRMLAGGARLAGDTILFSFDAALPPEEAARQAGAAELGLEPALEAAVRGSVSIVRPGGERRVRTALGQSFWAKRWEEGRIGFHEGKPNALLARHFARLETGAPLRVLVPLAGKSHDLAWLAARGHEVVGVEFAWKAVRAYFDERGLDAPLTRIGPHAVLSAGGVTLVSADFFAVGPAELGRFDAIYDRAALIALEPSTREAYAGRCRSFLAEGGAILLVALSYDQTKTHGPPWSADEATVRALYAPARVERLEQHRAPPAERLAQAGVPGVEETAYLIGGRH